MPCDRIVIMSSSRNVLAGLTRWPSQALIGPPPPDPEVHQLSHLAPLLGKGACELIEEHLQVLDGTPSLTQLRGQGPREHVAAAMECAGAYLF